MDSFCIDDVSIHMRNMQGIRHACSDRGQSRHLGGNAISTTITCGVIKGGTMVCTFGDCSSEELPFDPNGVDVPIESKRDGKN